MSRISTLATVIFALMLDVVVSRPAAAQVASYDEYSVSSLSQRISRAQRVRVLFASGQLIQMEDPTISGNTLAGVERRSRESVEYPVSDIRQVWVRRSSALTGLAVGASFGAVLGAFGGISLAQACFMGSCGSPSSGELAEAAALGAVAGAASIGFLGALIAAPIPKWRTVYSGDGLHVAPIIGPHQVGLSIRF